MPFSRQRPKVSSTGRISARFSTVQRDLLIHSGALPPKLGHALHHAPVREGKLSLRLSLSEIDAVVTAAAGVKAKDPTEDRVLRTLLKYLDSLEDRFEDSAEDEQ